MSSHNRTHEKIIVWDISIRLFHWVLVFNFIAAYLTAKLHFDSLHSLLGYSLCALLIARIIWGHIGSQYARFRSFVFTPKETLSYFRSLLHDHPQHYYGHNPAGALMVFALLGFLSLIILTGLATLAVIDFEGPMLFLSNYLSDDTSYLIRHLHSGLFNVALVMILIHVAGVILGSIQHKENLALAMITGKKRKQLSSGKEI